MAQHLTSVLALEGLDAARAARDPRLGDGLARPRRLVAASFDAARAPYPPREPQSAAEAWLALCAGVDPAVALAVARPALDAPGRRGDVMARAQASFVAAVLARAGDAADRARAARVARAVAGELDPSGRLHSTWDSGALIALLTALSRFGGRRALVDGVETTLGFEHAGRQAREVQALDSPVFLVAAQRARQDLDALPAPVPLSATLVAAGGPGARVHAGDAARLRVEIDRYTSGDLIHLELSPALVALRGGGRVHRLEHDLVGERRVEVPLLAVAPTHPGDGRAQTGLVLLRNMYDEARVGRVRLTVRVD